MCEKAVVNLNLAASAIDEATPSDKGTARAVVQMCRKELEWQCLRQNTLDKEGTAITRKGQPSVTLSLMVQEYNTRLQREESARRADKEENAYSIRGLQSGGWGTDGLAHELAK